MLGVQLTNKSTLKSVRLANETALEIAREERSSKRADELLALKRTIYAKLLADLTTLSKACILGSTAKKLPLAEQASAITRRMDASTDAANSLANVYLVAPSFINTLAGAAYEAALNCTITDSVAYIREGGKLRATMRDDLADQEFSTSEELESMTDIVLDRIATGSRATSVPERGENRRH